MYKYKASAHVDFVANPISQPSLEFSPIWNRLISEEISEVQDSSSAPRYP
jgi:hypothetical protein